MWRVTEVASAEPGGLTVHADFVMFLAKCPSCGSSRRARRYGAIDSSYRDAPFLGRQVTITVNAQRFRCADCGSAFFQDLTDMDGKRRMTARCAAYIIDQVMARSSMRDVSMIVGVDEKTVRNVFEDRGLIFSVGDPPSNDRFVCESCLGIYRHDEMRLAPPKHLGRWRKGQLRSDANVCRTCFDFSEDTWRAGVVRRAAAFP